MTSSFTHLQLIPAHQQHHIFHNGHMEVDFPLDGDGREVNTKYSPVRQRRAQQSAKDTPQLQGFLGLGKVFKQTQDAINKVVKDVVAGISSWATDLKKKMENIVKT